MDSVDSLGSVFARTTLDTFIKEVKKQNLSFTNLKQDMEIIERTLKDVTTKDAHQMIDDARVFVETNNSSYVNEFFVVCAKNAALKTIEILKEKGIIK